MKKLILLLCLMAWFVTPHAQIKIQYSSDSTRIKYATFCADSTRGMSAETLLVNFLRLDNNTSFVGIDTTYSPDSAYRHVKYVQYHNNYWVEHSQVVLTWHNGDIIRFNGYYLPTRNMSTVVNYSEEDAVRLFKHHYEIIEDSTQIYSSLLITSDTSQPAHPLLCYKLSGNHPTIYGKNIYVNTSDLSIVKESYSPGADFNATLYTKNYGVRPANTIGWLIGSDSSFVLRDLDAAVEICRIDSNVTNPGSGIPNTFYNNSCIWPERDTIYPQYTLDAYWAASSYSYYMQNTFGCHKKIFQEYFDHHTQTMVVPDTLTSIYIALNTLPGSAYWSQVEYNSKKDDHYHYHQNIIVIGIPDENHNARASIDEVVHEYAHIFSYQMWCTSLLQNSSFLAEACADIWAAILTNKIYSQDEDSVWKIGELVVLPNSGKSCVRNLANPSDITAETQIHSNNCEISSSDPYVDGGVISHWFYLLTHGYSGSNCNGDCCSFDAIPLDSAAKLLFHCERSSYFYDDISDYSEICQATIDAAENFANPEIIKTAVLRAWLAVGVKPDIAGIEQFGLDYTSDNTGSYYIDEDLVVSNLQTLTVKGTLFLNSDCSILVFPGSQLILDGGTLTSACPGEMWQGIEVVGDRTKHQTAANQGTVILRNNATIENAHCAVKTGLAGNEWLTAGGIVQCTGTTFRNNRRAVEFLSYVDTISPGFYGDNKSWFKDCTFTLNDTNLFLSQGMQFLNHVTLWDVKGVSFEGCTFKNLTTGNTMDRKHGIYAESAGFKVKTLCNSLDGCSCYGTADTSLFTGFSTAIEANTADDPYAVTIDEAKFVNNATGVKINSSNYATVTRCVFDLSQEPYPTRGNVGLRLDHTTGYLVEGNAFRAAANATAQAPMGVYVVKSMNLNNNIYRNSFRNLNRGITVSDTNGLGRTGLCFTCDTFENCAYGIYVNSNGFIAGNQGSLAKGADNKFTGTQTSSLYNSGSLQVNYYHSGNGSFILYNPTGVYTESNLSNANPCNSTLCDPVGPVNPVTNFAGLDVAVGTSDPSGATDGQGGGSGTSASQDDAVLQAVLGNYYEAVRRIMADSVENLQELAAWHAAAGIYADPYSLTETATALGSSATTASMMTGNMGTSLTASGISQPEMDNYADFRALAASLRPSANNPAVNWPAATPAQIDELQRIAEANTGRSSVMARGVLCFFFDICYEEEEGEMKGLLLETFHGTSLQGGTTGGLLVYPNPTEGTVTVEATGDSPIRNVTVLDMSGRVVDGVSHTPQSEHTYICTLDLRHLDSGIYIIRALKADGKTVSGKVVRN